MSRLPKVWSSLATVKMAAFGTLVSLVIVILKQNRQVKMVYSYLQTFLTHFFSPSNRRKESKAAGAFITSQQILASSSHCEKACRKAWSLLSAPPPILAAKGMWLHIWFIYSACAISSRYKSRSWDPQIIIFVCCNRHVHRLLLNILYISRSASLHLY